jgi:hypothetical protein
MQKIKNVLKGHKDHPEREGQYGNTTGTMAPGAGTHGTTGTAGTAGAYDTAGTTGTGTGGTYTEPEVVGVAEVPIVEERRHTAGMGQQEEVCGQKTFTELEDRPVVKERVERYVEHHPVEKQYVVETHFVGERPTATGAGVTVVGQDEYVVEAAEPGPKCPTGAGRVMDEVVQGTTGGMGTHGTAGTGMGGVEDRDRVM